MHKLKQFDTVRVVRSGDPTFRPFLATVLNVQHSHEEDDGANGEPTISIGFFDPDKAHLAGGADWHKGYRRIMGVRHQTHPEVVKGMHDYAYLDSIDAAKGTTAAIDEPQDDETRELSDAEQRALSESQPAALNPAIPGGDTTQNEASGPVRLEPSGDAATNPYAKTLQTVDLADDDEEEDEPQDDEVNDAAAQPADDGTRVAPAGESVGNPLGSEYQIAEYPEGAAERFRVKDDGIEIAQFDTREEAQAFIDSHVNEQPEPEATA
jgi:hypothetical protein